LTTTPLQMLIHTHTHTHTHTHAHTHTYLRFRKFVLHSLHEAREVVLRVIKHHVDGALEVVVAVDCRGVAAGSEGAHKRNEGRRVHTWREGKEGCTQGRRERKRTHKEGGRQEYR